MRGANPRWTCRVDLHERIPGVSACGSLNQSGSKGAGMAQTHAAWIRNIDLPSQRRSDGFEGNEDAHNHIFDRYITNNAFLDDYQG